MVLVPGHHALRLPLGLAPPDLERAVFPKTRCRADPVLRGVSFPRARALGAWRLVRISRGRRGVSGDLNGGGFTASR